MLITERPVAAMSIAVPKSGCVIIIATGINIANIGKIINLILLTSYVETLL
jgi:hypothetical protein